MVCDFRKKKFLAAALIIFFAILLVLGIMAGEFASIKNLGSYVCFGCIGLG